jgi:transposase-like protein
MCWVQKRRDKAAAKRFFRRVLRSNSVPRKIVTDQLRSYPAAKADECVPERLHCGRVLRVQMTEQDASGNRQQHLHVQNFVEGLSHDVVFR